MFRIGQKVLCVAPAPTSEFEGPIVGKTYIVRSLDFCERANAAAIRVHGLTLPFIPEFGREGAFRASRFRPIAEKKTDISIFEEILRRESVDGRVPART